MSRTRSKPVISVTGAGRYYVEGPLGPYSRVSIQPYSFEVYRKTETMTDEVIPNFHSRSKAGEVFNNPMSRTVVTATCVPSLKTDQSIVNGAASYKVQHHMDLCYTPACPAPANRQDTINRLITDASTQAMSRVSSETMNLLATLGEFRETKELVVRTCITLRHLGKVVDYYRYTLEKILHFKGKKGLAKKLYLDAENAWMQVRMGYRPFAYECKSLHEACTKIETKVKRQTFRGKATAKLSNAQLNVAWSSQSRSCRGNKTYDEDYTVRAGVLCERRVNGFPDTFGLTKIPQAIWELTKLSWAVDYFFNTAQLIAAYTPDTLWKPISAWYTERSRIDQVNTIITANYAGAFPPIDNGWRAWITESVKRSPGTSLGLIFRPKMNWAKFIDMVAVTRQHVGPKILDCIKAYQRMKTKRI